MRGVLPPRCLQTLLSPSPTSPFRPLVGTFLQPALSAKPQVFQDDRAARPRLDPHASLSARPCSLLLPASCLEESQSTGVVDLSMLDNLLGARAISSLSLRLAANSRPTGEAVHPLLSTRH